MYRNQPAPYAHAPQHLGTADYFRTSSPSAWVGKSLWELKFTDIYGETALITAKAKYIVPENIDPAFVGGTFWNDPIRRLTEVFGDAGSVTGSGEFPRPGVTSEDAEILSRLAKIESLCYQILAK